MAVFEQDQHAFEAKSHAFDPPNQIDLKTHESTLSNGHHDLSLPSVPSLNSKTDEVDAYGNELPMTNGFGHKEAATEPQMSFEYTSSLSNSAESGENHQNTSSQSAPDDDQDGLNKPVTETIVETVTSVIEQPTSDLREDVHPATAAEAAEIKEQKQHNDLLSDPDLTENASEPLTSTTEINVTSQDPEHQVEQSTEMAATMTEPAVSLEPAAATVFENIETGIETIVDAPPADPSSIFTEATPAELDKEPVLSSAALTMVDLQEDKSQEPPLEDQVMIDAPPSPGKLVREREEDDTEDAPSAKRARTDEGQEATADFKVPERPFIDTQVSQTLSQSAEKTASPITTPQYKALQRVMANIKRIQSSFSFRNPVDPVALNIPNYPNVVKNPMDLKTLEENLKSNKYSSVDAFVADFNLIVDNCIAFNGLEHSVTKQGLDMKASFEKQIKNVPGPEITEPSPAEKRKKSIPTVPRVPQPRRESRSAVSDAVRSPISAVSPHTTFALGPQGVPLIRRDSNVGDGRPKREIHPPASRDLPYANQKPKKKKFLWELKFCEHILKELEKPRYTSLSSPFMQPVDPVALNIPTYHSIIKKPMDFSTIRSRLNGGQYENAKEFEADARLVFQNCYKFNKPGEPVNVMGHQFEEIFDSEWAKKRDWIEANTPASAGQSPGSSDDEDSDEEEDAEEEEEENVDQIQVLQKQIAEMSKQVELMQQKKKSPPVSNKKAGKVAKPARRDSNKKSSAPSKSEKKSSKPAKKEKTPYVTYEQKQDISNRINALSEAKMATALKIIRDNMPTLKGVQDDELELDIDELSDEVLYKLLQFVRKHVPRDNDSPVRPAPAAAAAPSRKKNKPMSKHEQEARIAQVQSGLSAFQNPGGAPSSNAAGNDSSDGDDSSESEEE